MSWKRYKQFKNEMAFFFVGAFLGKFGIIGYLCNP